MSGFKERGAAPAKGLFDNGVWYCDCVPRKPAAHFEVKKESPNMGKWFRSCQKQQGDKTRCQFFLWDVDAHPREAASLANNSRIDLRLDPTTPSKHRSSPPPPYTVEAGPSEPSRKRSRAMHEGSDDELGFKQANDSFNDELGRVLTAVETPNKMIKTSTSTTPSTKRKLQWEANKSATPSVSLQTLPTDRRAVGDPFNKRPPALTGIPTPLTFNKHDTSIYQNTTAPSCFDTPTPNRFKNMEGNDLTRDVLDLLQAARIRLDVDGINNLKTLLSKHANRTEGYKRGRDVLRTIVKAKDAKITELTYRVKTLEAELDEQEETAMNYLRWDTQDEPDMFYEDII